MSIVKNVDLVYHPAPRANPKNLDEPAKGDFNNVLKSAMGEVGDLQEKANQSIQQMVGEGKGDLQETMIALEKADVSFKLMMQIRNKVLDAYQEIMRMQV
jgi:flagellar hook-basal body complex protein FliE